MIAVLQGLRLLGSVSGFVFVVVAAAVLGSARLSEEADATSRRIPAYVETAMARPAPTPVPLGPAWYLVASVEEKGLWWTRLANEAEKADWPPVLPTDQATSMPMDLVTIIVMDGDRSLDDVVQAAADWNATLPPGSLPVKVVDLR